MNSSNRELDVASRQNVKIRGLNPAEGGIPLQRTLTSREVVAVMFTMTLVCGYAVPSAEGISLGVLTGLLLTHNIPPFHASRY